MVEKMYTDADGKRRALSDAELNTLHERTRHLSAKGAAWVREHPQFALDDRKLRKAAAGHFLAMSEGLAEDSPEYYRRIEEHCGVRGADGKRNIRVLADGKRSDPTVPNQMTRGEYHAATEVVRWGREGGDKCGEPIGVEEYLKRRDAIRKDPRWVRLD
jgi:hypothetical protein